MKKEILLTTLFCVLLIYPLFAQQVDSVSKPKSHFSLSVSTGWSHYINSLETVDAKDVGKDFIGLNLRFLWEPGYRLGIGLETGFYRIYNVKQEFTPEVTGQSRLYCYPLLLVARMRIVDHFYLSVAPGLSILVSDISGVDGKTVSSQLSLANFEATASYLYPVSKHFLVGGEARFLIIGKVEDYLYSVQATCAVRL